AELAPLAGDELDVVDDRAGRHVAEGERVARPDVGTGPGLNPVVDLEAGGREDVALLAVGIVQERDVAAAIGVVLDRRHAGGHAVLAPLEVDAAVAALGAAAAVAGGDAAVVVAAARLAKAFGQLALRLARGQLLAQRV